jgi:hypothetical protein
MPRILSSRDQVNATLIITTSDHVERCQQFRFCVERLGSTPKASRPKNGLYGSSEIADHPLPQQTFVGPEDEERHKLDIAKP